MTEYRVQILTLNSLNYRYLQYTELLITDTYTELLIADTYTEHLITYTYTEL